MKRAALALLLLTGCGYRFTAPNASLPGGVQRVRVPVFQNKTSEAGLELAFTQAAKDQLERAGRLGDANAEASLEGTVLWVSGGPAMGAPTLPRSPVFRIAVAVQLSLMKGTAAVSGTTVTVSEEYPSGPDVLLTEANRAAALRRIADTAIRDGLERLQTVP